MSESVRIDGTGPVVHLPGPSEEYARQAVNTSFRQRMFALFDPDRPTENADDLRNRMRGQHNNPHAMLHQCPSCERPPMAWSLFQAHALPCYIKNRKVVLDVTHRKFQGGGPENA